MSAGLEQWEEVLPSGHSDLHGPGKDSHRAHYRCCVLHLRPACLAVRSIDLRLRPKDSRHRCRVQRLTASIGKRRRTWPVRLVLPSWHRH